MSTRPDSFLNEIYEKNSAQFCFNARNREEWLVWKQELKKILLDKLGFEKIPKGNMDLNVSLLENVEENAYTRQRVMFSTTDHLEMLAYVLIPKGKSFKLPAVVACHGHGYGSRSIVGLTAEGLDNSLVPGYQMNFALELVKRGFLVIVPEILGFGDRRMAEDARKPLEDPSCYRLSTYLLMMGMTTIGLRVYETMRSIDYILSREDVDPDRIGCMGISGGGMVCAFTAALDERLKASVISGYACTFKDSIMSITHCIDNFIPGISGMADMPDIIGLIAPRPLLIECGDKDQYFPISGVLKALEVLDKIYSFLDEREKLDKDIFNGRHQVSGIKAYDWLCKWV